MLDGAWYDLSWFDNLSSFILILN